MKSVRGVLETAGVVHGFVADVGPICELGETAFLITVIMFFLPAILLYSMETDNLYILFAAHARNPTPHFAIIYATQCCSVSARIIKSMKSSTFRDVYHPFSELSTLRSLYS